MSDSNETNLATILLVGLAILVLGSTLMMGFAMPMLGGMYGYGGMDGLGIIGVLVQLAFLLVVLGGGYLLVRRVTDHTASHDGAMDGLRTAYARGDLSDEEFETRREKLDNN
jgi:putative membrane protein